VGVARSQGSPTYELRATRALARLLIEQGRIDEARDRLTHARALFVEGSDVPELTRTDQLIAEIG
jgi:hypothetical protein